MEGAVERAAPNCPERSARAGELHDLMMLEGAEGLRNDGVGAAREVHDGAEVVLQLGVIGL